jgi:anionic cell wall polymer biosynthesis LytR-Cps2A-Psr (LCP) family protein
VSYEPTGNAGRGTVYGRAHVPVGDGPGDHGEKPPRRRSPLARVLVLLGVLVLVVVVAGTATGAYLVHKYNGNVQRVDNVFGNVPAADRPAKPVDGATNILLVGYDSARKGPPRSDTIMVLHLPASGSKAYIVSIPRDSWVQVPGRGRAKINASFSWGGPSLLIQTIENFTDLRIDHFAEIDFDGFQAMTDAVGGVTVPGAGHLNGTEALKYVRERKSLPRGDFDRIVRQQAFIKALLAKSSASFSDPGALLQLADAGTKAVKVDSGLSAWDLQSLALRMRNAQGGNLVFSTTPTAGTGWAGGQSVVFLDKTAGIAMWTAMREDRMAEWKAAQQ